MTELHLLSFDTNAYKLRKKTNAVGIIAKSGRYGGTMNIGKRLFYVAFCVRDWSGILCELPLVREREQVTEPVEVTGVSTSSTTESGDGSEQRYSGKPDGGAGTPKLINNA